MSQGGKLLPNLDQNGTKLLNLTVLQRIDPCIEEILLTVAHVAFYEFNLDLNQWSRKDVEGSLFVVKRNIQPRFQFIVMNRRSTENLMENLLGDFEFEVQVPYLLYRNAAQEVNGIWFYNSRECEEVANLFNRILNAYSKVSPTPNIPSSKSEFEELEAVPSMAAVEGAMEQLSTSTDVAEDSSFSNFYNAAPNLGNNAPNVQMPGQLYHPSSSISSSSSASTILPTPVLPLQLPSAVTSNPSVPLSRLHNASNPIHKSNQITNLVKPSSFLTSPSPSSAVMMPSVPSSVSTAAPQHPYGAPLLQPFPPPSPPLSLTPTNSSNYVPIIDRDKVRHALLMLAQDARFIELLYQALQKAHHT
ncbi:hypothetical protein Nepgr_025000 [Nepenthes gracilis]|uniref:mRNA-decapping enzyme-like protein n=1 Tax=Nepenthes gracilis TaxID=150966 RepID=A0AAD3XZ53_NEPGR|nr:hypothetical protein Nepgr_025000 [Nepenthes gracilis]